MIKPDLIVLWPRAIDFPVFRVFISDNRHLFNKIIAVITVQCEQRNLTSFLKITHPDWTIIDTYEGKDRCWYDSAFQAGLKQSTSDYVLFTEQDFVINDNTVLSAMFNTSYDLLYYKEYSCGLYLAKRECIEKTSKNFSIVEGYQDLFYFFDYEIRNTTTNVNCINHIIPINKYYHISGLSTIYYLMEKIYNHPEEKETCMRLLRTSYGGAVRANRAYIYNKKSIVAANRIAVTNDWLNIMNIVNSIYTENKDYLRIGSAYIDYDQIFIKEE